MTGMSQDAVHLCKYGFELHGGYEQRRTSPQLKFYTQRPDLAEFKDQTMGL